MRSTTLKPKEKFRFRMQRLLSRKPVVAAACAVSFALWFLSISWGVHLLAYMVLPLMRGDPPDLSTKTLLDALVFVPELKWAYLLAAAFSAVLAVKLGFHMVYAFEPLADTHTKGHQRWETLPALKQQYRSVPESCHGPACDLDGPGGIPVSRYQNRILIDDGPVNNLILGITRSGKGEILMLPIIDLFSRPKKPKERASLILSDPKGELAATTGDTLRARGYDVYVFSLKPPMDGMSYNPLELVKEAYIAFLGKNKRAQAQTDPVLKKALIRDADAESANAETYARSLAYIINYDPNSKEKIWQEWGTAITTAAILAVVCDCCEMAQKCIEGGQPEEAEKWYAKITMYSVSRFIVDYCNPDPENPDAPPLLDQYIMRRKWAARYQYSPVNVADNRTKGNITAETLAKLTQLMLTPVAKLTSKNDLRFADIGFGEKPVALFLVTPDSDHSNDFILSMLITQLYQALCRKADQMPGNKCARQVRFELDEFGNIPALPHMDSMVTVCLGRNIRFDLVIQSYGQLDALYGKDAARTILGNCGNQYFLKSNDPETLKKFSSMIGSRTIATMSRFGNPLSLDKNMQESTDTMPLLDENGLAQLDLGEIVVVHAMHTQDLKGRSILPYPIFNCENTRMKPRFQYLQDVFPIGKSFSQLNLSASCTHIDVALEDIVYDPIGQGVTAKETLQHSAAAKDVALEAGPAHEGPRVVSYPQTRIPSLFMLLGEDERAYFLRTLRDLNVLSPPEYHALPTMGVTEFETAMERALEAGRISQRQYDQLRSDVANALDKNLEKEEKHEASYNSVP